LVTASWIAHRHEPLYAFRVAFDAAAEPNGIFTREIVLGVRSLIPVR
jgi:hypothetical protein